MKVKWTANESLWGLTGPRIEVDPSRWEDYDYFFDALGEYQEIPQKVWVEWLPFDDFLRYLDPEEEAEMEGGRGFVRRVAGWIRRGVDVPPLVRYGSEIGDGVHRAWAAKSLKLQVAPTILLPPLR